MSLASAILPRATRAPCRPKCGKIRTPLELANSISGLADMYQLYDNVTTLKWVPMDIRGLFRFLAFVFGPLVPIMLPSALLWAAQYLPK